MLMSTLFARSAAASALLVAIASPALAAPNANAGITVRYDAKADRYCITPKTAPTGSMLRVADCRSKAEWAKAGTTITTKADVQLANR